MKIIIKIILIKYIKIYIKYDRIKYNKYSNIIFHIYL